MRWWEQSKPFGTELELRIIRGRVGNQNAGVVVRIESAFHADRRNGAPIQFHVERIDAHFFQFGGGGGDFVLGNLSIVIRVDFNDFGGVDNREAEGSFEFVGAEANRGGAQARVVGMDGV